MPYPLIYDHGWQIDFHSLEAALTNRTRAVIVVHPNNPTGHFTKSEETTRLNQICAARAPGDHSGRSVSRFRASTDGPPSSFAANRASVNVHHERNIQDLRFAQMKTAWLITSGPEEIKARAIERLEVIADTYLSMNAPVQYALATFLDQRQGFQAQVMMRVPAKI